MKNVGGGKAEVEMMWQRGERKKRKRKKEAETRAESLSRSWGIIIIIIKTADDESLIQWDLM